MSDRYDDGEDGLTDERLDEFLCEYVDGSMEASVKTAFEEYLAQNPTLAEHVRQLVETRRLLCRQQRCAHAPRDLQHRLQVEIARDLMGASPRQAVFGGLGRFATITSAFGMAVLLGALVGTSLVQRPFVAQTTAATDRIDREEQPSVPSDAHGFTTKIRPRTIQAAGFGVLGPSTAMPELAWSRAMTPIGGSDSLSASALRRTHAVP